MKGCCGCRTTKVRVAGLADGVHATRESHKNIVIKHTSSTGVKICVFGSILFRIMEV